MGPIIFQREPVWMHCRKLPTKETHLKFLKRVHIGPNSILKTPPCKILWHPSGVWRLAVFSFYFFLRSFLHSFLPLACSPLFVSLYLYFPFVRPFLCPILRPPILPLNSCSLVRSIRFVSFSLLFVSLLFPWHHTPHRYQQILFTRLLKLSLVELCPKMSAFWRVWVQNEHAVFGDASIGSLWKIVGHSQVPITHGQWPFAKCQ